MLVIIFAYPKHNVLKCIFLVCRVSGTNRKQYVMPDIVLRAVQGHSTRGDVSLEYLIAAQENSEQNRKIYLFSVSMEQITQGGKV